MAADTKHTTVLPKIQAGRAKAAGAGGRVEPGSIIPNSSERLLLENAREMRNVSRVVEAVRKIAKRHPIVSTAAFNLVQVASSGWRIKAFDSRTHRFSPEGTNMARSVLAAMNTLYDYSRGYADKPTTRALTESMLREVVLTSAVAGELVLDKHRLPDRIQVVPYETLRYKKTSDGGKYPVQQGVSAEDIDLNIPTFWVSELQKEASEAYTVSLLLAAIDMAHYFSEFVEDMRRVVRRTGHSRTLVKLAAERVQAAAPAEVRADPEKLNKWMEEVRKSVEDIVSSLEPEDALVAFDTVTLEEVSAKGEKADYKDLLTALSGMLATSLKSHPSILGLRLEGSQSLSNTESLVYMKVASAIQGPVEDLMSRALTLAVRLYGVDVYVHFRFKAINLRPEEELEAFRTMKQNRVLQLLSLGLITDEEASEELDLEALPEGYQPLSGTHFMDTNTVKEPSPNADPQGRALQPDTPNKAGGESQ